MVHVDIHGTTIISMICRAEPRDYGRRDTQVDAFRQSKLKEAWKSKSMETGKAVMCCGRNSNKFTTWPKDISDLFITHIKNQLKSRLGKNVVMSLLFST